MQIFLQYPYKNYNIVMISVYLQLSGKKKRVGNKKTSLEKCNKKYLSEQNQFGKTYLISEEPFIFFVF